MSNDLKNIVAEIKEKRKLVEPSENAFMAKFNSFAKEIKTYVRENKWYDSNNRYCMIAEVSYFYISMMYFPDDNPDKFWVTVRDGYDTEDLEFTYSEIENPVASAKLDYDKYIADKNATEAKWKNARRAELLRELNKLD